MHRAVIALFLLLPDLGLTQSSTPPAFEAAVVRPNKSGDPASRWNMHPGGLEMYNMSIKNIVKAAYGIQDAQFSGTAWLDGDRYSIEAKADGTANGKQMLLMLQNLLAERFQLAVHREQRMVAGYALVVSKSGLKIRPSDVANTNEHRVGNQFTATHVEMPRLARFLERVVGQPVIDATHVTGGFDFVLEYADERRQQGDADSAGPSLPSIFTALNETLGLKLDPRKVPVEMLVVDHAERPSDN
jgi:uncharacterized protein (TIGR03435 family)